MFKCTVNSRETLRERLKRFEISQADEADSFKRLQEINLQLMRILAEKVAEAEQAQSELLERTDSQSARIQELEENHEILEYNKNRLQTAACASVPAVQSFLPYYNCDSPIGESDLLFCSVDELLEEGDEVLQYSPTL